MIEDEASILSDASFVRQFMPHFDARAEDDRALMPEFFLEKKLNSIETQRTGRPVYEDVECIRIRIKGQPLAVAVEEATHQHKQRFPIAYQRFQMNKPQALNGTAIDQMPNVGPATIENLKNMGIRTIEDLAEVTDANVIMSIGTGANQLIKQAQAYVDQTSTRVTDLEQQNAKLAGENMQLQELIAKMNERLNALEAGRQKPVPPPDEEAPAPRRKPGRKPGRKSYVTAYDRP